MTLLNACVPIERQAICRKGICYGRTKQSFIYTFYNYYRRGISFEGSGILVFNEGDDQMAARGLPK